MLKVEVLMGIYFDSRGGLGSDLSCDRRRAARQRLDVTLLVGSRLGRFTVVRRLPLLVEAFAKAKADITQSVPLVPIGGRSGEWEDEHPFETIQRAAGRESALGAGRKLGCGAIWLEGRSSDPRGSCSSAR